MNAGDIAGVLAKVPTLTLEIEDLMWELVDDDEKFSVEKAYARREDVNRAIEQISEQVEGVRRIRNAMQWLLKQEPPVLGD